MANAPIRIKKIHENLKFYKKHAKHAEENDRLQLYKEIRFFIKRAEVVAKKNLYFKNRIQTSELIEE